MTSMPATGGHNAACCNIPPVVSSGYQSKGSYKDIGGYKTYVTGPESAEKAIVVIFDIFGFFEQTIQGADILAYSDDHTKYRVYMPDWFNGNPCSIEDYPPDTEEKQKRLGDFFAKYSPPSIAEKLPGYVDAIKSADTSVSKFGILGFCWGGKVSCLAVKAPSSVFSVAGSVHPAMVDKADAEGLTKPVIMLASGEESEEDVNAYSDALKGPKHVEVFKDQVHGWMAARSDLKNPRVKEEYERGYKALLKFFGEHL